MELFALDGYINATIILILLAVGSQAVLWAFFFFHPEGLDTNAYRNIVIDSPFHFVSILIFVVFWSIVAGITAIFVTIDYWAFLMTTIVASVVMFAAGKNAFLRLFLTVNYYTAEVTYFSSTALLKAGLFTFLAPMIVAYVLALCFGWVYWVSAVAVFVVAFTWGYVLFRMARETEL